jgi:hypothetical protein
MSIRGPRRAKKNKVIHVPDIVLYPKFILHEVVQLVQVNVGKKLRSKGAHRDAPPFISVFAYDFATQP